MGDGGGPREKSPTVEAPTVGERSRAWLFLGKGLRLWLPTVASPHVRLARSRGGLSPTPRGSIPPRLGFPPRRRPWFAARFPRSGGVVHAGPTRRPNRDVWRAVGSSAALVRPRLGLPPRLAFPVSRWDFPTPRGSFPPRLGFPRALPPMVRAISAVWGRRSCRPHATPDSQRLAGRRFDQKTLPHQRTRPCTRKDSRSGPSTGISG